MEELQKKTAQAIVNIFETGRPLGNYGSVTVVAGDAGHLTYGRSQTTLASGNLALLLHSYCEAGGQLSDSLKTYLASFDRRDLKLDDNEKVKALLRQAGDDPIMRNVQDEFFDRIYWEPALRSAANIGISEPLGITVIYDSKIHGSYDTIKNLVNQQAGSVQDLGEETWMRTYVSTRRDWLANHSNPVLHKTVYRMDSFQTLIDENKWDLSLPLTVRNVVINEELLSGQYEPPAKVSATDTGERVLFLTKPLMKGEDVKKLQEALNFSEGEVDGVFGPVVDAAVREFQSAHGLKSDGKVGPATWAALGY